MPKTVIRRSNFKNSVAKINSTNKSELSQYGNLKLSCIVEAPPAVIIIAKESKIMLKQYQKLGDCWV